MGRRGRELIVVDSSAVIAILLQEVVAPALAARLHRSPPGERFLSVANYVEAGAVLAGRLRVPEQALPALDAFTALAGVSLVPVDEAQARLALEARILFGKGFGTTGKLNYGDSFAYALAKSLDAPLLFTGDDFAGTDLRPALEQMS